MNVTKLNYIMRQYQPIFRGVFGKNELDAIQLTGYPFCLISNSSDFGKKGTHWVAIYFDVSGNCDYFDLYGDITIADIRLFIGKHTGDGGKLEMNRKQIHSFRSDVCCQYCIYFLSKCIM